jgi:ribonucleotide monophosphatase NagD (HAD superfamily)
MEGLIDAGPRRDHADQFFRRYVQTGAGRAVSVSQIARAASLCPGRVKLIKPDQRIYDLHTQVFGLEPKATLFIDDNPANVQAAKDYGWAGGAVCWGGQAEEGFGEIRARGSRARATCQA